MGTGVRHPELPPQCTTPHSGGLNVATPVTSPGPNKGIQSETPPTPTMKQLINDTLDLMVGRVFRGVKPNYPNVTHYYWVREENILHINHNRRDEGGIETFILNTLPLDFFYAVRAGESDDYALSNGDWIAPPCTRHIFNTAYKKAAMHLVGAEPTVLP